jgi:signal transduction histidine kinase
MLSGNSNVALVSELEEEGFQRPEGKKMVIEAVPVENGMVDVHIRNNGPEIPENIKGRIF